MGLSVFSLIIVIMTIAGFLICLNPSNDRKDKLLALIVIPIFIIVSAGYYLTCMHARGFQGSPLAIFEPATDKHIALTPVMDKIETARPGDILIYYKYGCKDCEAIYEDLKADIETITGESGNIYFIETQSSYGQALLQDYPVSQVPAIVLVKENGAFHYEDPSTATENGVTYNPDALSAILQDKSGT